MGFVWFIMALCFLVVVLRNYRRLPWAQLWKIKKLIILWVGIFLIVLMGLFPPWVLEREIRNYGEDIKYTTEPGPYSWIGKPPRAYRYSSKSDSFVEVYPRPKFVDLYRLGIQYFVVAVVAAGLIITLRDKKDPKQ